MPVKEVFFPPTERLMAIEIAGQQVDLQETLPQGRLVVFGVRPCDARGVKVLDAAFVETSPVDPYYAARRKSAILIGLACHQMHPGCFCTSMGLSPVDGRDMDLMLVELERGYLVQVFSDKGEEFLELHPLVPGPAVYLDHREEPALIQPANKPAVPSPAAVPWLKRFEDPYWEEMAERCLSCRVCAYACPTCRCFAVRDEALPASGPGKYERIRCWDSCAGENYRRIAGGHNPRPQNGQRLRNRFMCKFYYYPQQYGPQACTGCGRCIELCPVNIDITEVLRDLAEVEV
jgi:ferredoxin